MILYDSIWHDMIWCVLQNRIAFLLSNFLVILIIQVDIPCSPSGTDPHTSPDLTSRFMLNILIAKISMQLGRRKECSIAVKKLPVTVIYSLILFFNFIYQWAWHTDTPDLLFLRFFSLVTFSIQFLFLQFRLILLTVREQLKASWLFICLYWRQCLYLSITPLSSPLCICIWASLYLKSVYHLIIIPVLSSLIYFSLCLQFSFLTHISRPHLSPRR